MNVFKQAHTGSGAHFGGLVQIALVLGRGRGNTVAHITALTPQIHRRLGSAVHKMAYVLASISQVLG